MWAGSCDGNGKIARSVDKVAISEFLTSVLSLRSSPNYRFGSYRLFVSGPGNRQQMHVSTSVVLGNLGPL